MQEIELSKQLKENGFDPVYIWDAEPNESDPDHTHDFDVKLIVLSGEIVVKTFGNDRKDLVLRSGDEVFIPREQVHSGLVGKEGCRYLVGEKH